MPSTERISNLYQEEYYQLKKSKNVLGYRSYEKQKDILLPYFNKRLRQIDKLRDEKKGKLLDIGCAEGFFLEIAKKDGWEVFGIDISEYAIKALKKKGIKGHLGNLKNAKFRNNTFDAVTIFQTIEHDSNPVSLLKEIHRILKPGGMILLTTPGQKGLLINLLGKKWHGWQVEGHLLWFNKKNLELGLKKAGFIEQRVYWGDRPFSSLLDTFEAIYYRYPNFITEYFNKVIKKFPACISEALIVPPIDLWGLSATAIK